MAEPSGGSTADGQLLSRDTLLVTGPDRKSWLDGLLTCAVADVAPGAARYGLLLTKQGKIVSDVLLADSGSELYVGVAAGHGPAVRELLDRYLVMEDAELGLPPAPVAWQLSVAAAATVPVATELASGALELRDLSLTVRVVSAAPAAATSEALSALLARHGLGLFGVDFGERDNPHEASLDRIAVSWTKGCYLGQEVVCMQDMRGKVKRRLVALEGESALLAAAPAAGSETLSVLGGDGAAVGHVTSVHSGLSGAAQLLASISSAALEGPSELSVQGHRVRVVAGSGTQVS